MKSTILASTLLAAVLTGAAFAQSGAPIKLANVAELSGGGATVGTNWKNGIDLAIEEINAKGGVLGRPLQVSHADSQSNPGVARAQVQKALDGEPYVLLGPGYSGSVKVTAPLAAEAGIADINYLRTDFRFSWYHPFSKKFRMDSPWCCRGST